MTFLATSVSSLSTQYVQVPVTELDSGLPVNPTGNVVSLAFVLGRANPQVSDWLTGSWEPDSVNGQYLAQVLIGPSGLLALTPGNYTVWIKVDAAPETVIIQTGGINVY